jgi:hypothetical protein
MFPATSCLYLWNVVRHNIFVETGRAPSLPYYCRHDCGLDPQSPDTPPTIEISHSVPYGTGGGGEHFVFYQHSVPNGTRRSASVSKPLCHCGQSEAAIRNPPNGVPYLVPAQYVGRKTSFPPNLKNKTTSVAAWEYVIQPTSLPN